MPDSRSTGISARIVVTVSHCERLVEDAGALGDRLLARESALGEVGAWLPIGRARAERDEADRHLRKVAVLAGFVHKSMDIGGVHGAHGVSLFSCAVRGVYAETPAGCLGYGGPVGRMRKVLAALGATDARIGQVLKKIFLIFEKETSASRSSVTIDVDQFIFAALMPNG